MIEEITYGGKLIDQCSLAGETREDGFFPGHINAAQLSKDRFLLVYTTRGWRGSDDNTSVIYQIRDGAYDGPMVREGRLAESIGDWEPRDDGVSFVKSHLHPLVFGVPKGARIGGKTPQHAGLFTFMWHRYARHIDPDTGFMPGGEDFEDLKSAFDATTLAEWTQLRLNEKEDDFDVVQPVKGLRQKGYESGYAFCEEDVRLLILTFTPPVPYNRDGTEWIGSTTASTSSFRRLACLKFTYSTEKDRYEWTKTSPLSADGLFESSVLPYRGSWIVSSRVWANWDEPMGGPVAWMRTDNPFEEIPDPTLPQEPKSRAPSPVFRCADGQVRVLTNDRNLSPYKEHIRNPLYIYDIDVEAGFTPEEHRVVFDSVERGLPIRDVSRPVVDQGKVFPHVGGKSQFTAHRVRTGSLYNPQNTGVVINEAEKEASGIYYSIINYDREYPSQWAFE